MALPLFPIANWGGAAPSSLLTGLAAYWPINPSGQLLTDLGPSALTLTDNGGVGSAAGRVYPNAGLFGNLKYLSRADSALTRLDGSDWTIAVWCYPTATGTVNLVAKDAGGASREFSIRFLGTLNPNVTLWSGGATLQLNFSASGACTLNAWNLLVITYDKTTRVCSVRINNGTAQTATAGANPSAGAVGALLTIGARASSPVDAYFPGRIGPVGFWRRVLTTPEQAALWGASAGSPYPFTPPLALSLTTPVAYQTIQRVGTVGTIAISGTTTISGSVEARFNGGSFATIATGLGAFSGSLTGQAQGQGTLEVRIVGDPSSMRSVANVGIGDVFVIAGQSNGGGRGTNNQAWSGTPTPTLFDNAYGWRVLADPNDSSAGQLDSVSNDGASPGGSVWPGVATAYLASVGVPIAFVPCTKGGSASAQWQPGANHQDRATLYGSMVFRALITGAKAVLWWQGEEDAVESITQAAYSSNLAALATAIWADLGVPLLPCKLQTFTDATQPKQDAINAAIGANWGVGHVLAGPDLTGITTQPENVVHLITDAKLAAAAALWWTALKAAFGYP